MRTWTRLASALVLIVPFLGVHSLADPPEPSAAPHSPPAAKVEAAPAERVEADTPRTTSTGATFTVPGGWSVRRAGTMVVLEPPENDLHVALVDVEATDADAAVASGWKAYKLDFARPLHLKTKQAPRNGWEERYVYEYETSPNEKIVVTAFVQRAGTAWVVGIVDGQQATLEKRGGPLGLLFNSLRPMGYSRESFAGKAPHPLDAGRIAILKDFLASGMKKLGVPGVGFSLIEHGRIVYVGGLGVRELGKPEPVDADTLFIAASNTKAMTTLMLAELVDEKKLRWDEPVIEAYPSFKLGDAATTRQVQIKHLICACTGMPRQDLEWILEFKNATAVSSLKLLGGMQPTSKFGEVFQYSNLMAAAAGYIGGSIAVPNKELGAAYDAAMRDRVFGPLHMTRTTFDFARAQKGNSARPHDFDVDGKLSLGRMDLNYAVVPVRPAGGMWTSARDLSQYVMMELAKGKLPDGKRLVSEENLAARLAPNVVASEDVTYGMGLIVDNRWGVRVVRHGGDLEGYHSDMMWLPDHGIGAVILTNSNPGFALRGPFLRRMLEVLFDGKPEAEAQLAAGAEALDADRKKTRERLVIPPDPAEAAKLATRYVNASLGNVAVSHKGTDLIVDIGEWSARTASRKNDDGSVSFITIDPTLQGFEFVVGTPASDGKRTLIVRDAQHEYVFTETK